jgi:arabinofuranosyltransferase
MKRLTLPYQDALLAGLVLALFTTAFIRTAWIAEDAFITFRVIDNILSGLGAVWNTAERVQVYTHPLWLAILLPLVWLFRDPYWAALLLGYAFFIGTLLVLIRLCRPIDWTALGVLTLLLMSRSVLDYSSSGLENSLVHFLYATFGFVWLLTNGPHKSLVLGVIAGLLYLSRPDSVVMVLPVLAYCFVEDFRRGPRTVVSWLPSLALVLGWTAFSLFYYGSPVPNTALAKVGTGLSLWRKAELATNYLLWSFKTDPITPAVIVTALLLGAWTPERRIRLLTAGLGLWGLYLVSVGADYMGGRFLSGAVVVSAVILVFALRRLALPPLMIWLMALCSLYSLRFTLLSPVNFSNRVIAANGVADERGFYYQHLGLLPVLERGNWSSFPWLALGSAIQDKPGLYVSCVIGMFGYTAGPVPMILDSLSLADPFLARLPSRDNARVGHYERAFPPGYLETRFTGQNKITDPNLARLWDLTRSVTQDPLWSWPRLKAIVDLNVTASQLVKKAQFDRNAVKLPGRATITSEKLSCMGQPASLTPMWRVESAARNLLTAVPLATEIETSRALSQRGGPGSR